MQPVTAVDSIAPAIERTREFLFRPFKWSTYLKLGLVAIITEGLGENFHSPHLSHGEGGGRFHATTALPSFHPAPGSIAIVAASVALAIVLSLFIFYLITRLRFAFFYSLVHSVKEIGPGWRLYRAQASRFFRLNIVVGICFMLLMALMALPFAAGFWRLYQLSQQGGHLEIGLMLAVILPLIPIVILLAAACVLTDVILRDWMMPHMAMDDATAGEAWRQVRARITAEKKQFIVYAILRVVLPTIAAIGVFLLLALPGFMLAGIVAAIEFGVYSAFSGATGVSWLVGVVVEIFFGVVAFVFALLASICVGGPLSTGAREYALIFYGGRYKTLGDVLYPAQAIAGGSSRPA